VKAEDDHRLLNSIRSGEFKRKAPCVLRNAIQRKGGLVSLIRGRNVPPPYPPAKRIGITHASETIGRMQHQSCGRKPRRKELHAEQRVLSRARETRPGATQKCRRNERYPSSNNWKRVRSPYSTRRHADPVAEIPGKEHALSWLIQISSMQRQGFLNASVQTTRRGGLRFVDADLITAVTGILPKRAFEVLRNANVVDYQARRLVSEHSVHAGNCLHQLLSSTRASATSWRSPPESESTVGEGRRFEPVRASLGRRRSSPNEDHIERVSAAGNRVQRIPC
jgi:hypothetical protein